MPKDLLQVSRRLSLLVQEQDVALSTLSGITKELCLFTHACVAIIDVYGKLLSFTKADDMHTIFKLKESVDGTYIDSQLADQLRNIVELRNFNKLTNFYLKGVTPEELLGYTATVLPLGAATERVGTMIIYSNYCEAVEEDIVVLKICGIIALLLIKHAHMEQTTEHLRKTNVVKSAISTLSYSELEAILHVFDGLEGNEGLIIASKIADKVGITRSVIVNAIRKFESAGVIESRSLGMKGTYLKVLNDMLISELNKIRH